MSSFSDSMRAAEAAARKVFGADIRLSLARAPVFGHDDVCLIVAGARHDSVARSFQIVRPQARVSQQTSCAWMGRPAYTYSIVEWKDAQ